MDGERTYMKFEKVVNKILEILIMLNLTYQIKTYFLV